MIVRKAAAWIIVSVMLISGCTTESNLSNPKDVQSNLQQEEDTRLVNMMSRRKSEE